MMKVPERLRRIFISSWLLALIPAIIIALILPPLGAKYYLEVGEKGFQSSRVYEDLNSDGITEMININKGLPYYNVVIHDNDTRVYDQWNLKYDITGSLLPLIIDNYDNDKYREIYVFTYSGDSIFLNINEFFEKDGFKAEKIFIERVAVVEGTITTNLYPAGFFDVNNDGFSELYFSLHTGFGLEPRHIYYFDIKNRILKTSQFFGTIITNPEFSDVDGDQKPEIFGSSQAGGNYHVPTPYSDWSAWLMVFDENLNFEFPPVEFPGLTNNLLTYAYKYNGKSGYAVSYNTHSADKSIAESRIIIFSHIGDKLKEKLYKEYGFESSVSLHVLEGLEEDRLFIFGSELLELDQNLEIINREDVPAMVHYYSYIIDIDDNGIKEFLLYSEIEKKLVVLNTDLKIIAQTEFDASNSLFRFSRYRSVDGISKTHISGTDFECLIELKRNDSYYLGYLIYPIIYLLVVLFIKIITKIAVRQVEERENLKQRLLSLQLQGIKSQLDPHFTFNSLNSIGSLIYLEERQAAYDYLNKFTRLLRGMLNDAERVYRTLGEEIEFVTNYLELEKMRFGDKLEFSINVADEISGDEKVPKLVMHTFAENAIKHGIIPSMDGGKLLITVTRESDYLRIIIEDNGIGRVKAAGQSLSTGKGLKLTGEFYDILNQLNKKPITHSITDLYDGSGAPCGTRVEVFVPVT